MMGCATAGGHQRMPEHGRRWSSSTAAMRPRHQLRMGSRGQLMASVLDADVREHAGAGLR